MYISLCMHVNDYILHQLVYITEKWDQYTQVMGLVQVENLSNEKLHQVTTITNGNATSVILNYKGSTYCIGNIVVDY